MFDDFVPFVGDTTGFKNSLHFSRQYHNDNHPVIKEDDVSKYVIFGVHHNGEQNIMATLDKLEAEDIYEELAKEDVNSDNNSLFILSLIEIHHDTEINVIKSEFFNESDFFWSSRNT